MSGAVTWEILAMMGAVTTTTITMAIVIFKLIASLRKDIADHKLSVAEKYVTKDSLRDEMRALRESLDGLTARIDRVLEK